MATVLFNSVERERIIAEARLHCVSVIERAGGPNLDHPPEHHCVLYAFCLAAALRRVGVQTVFQAGTCMWPRLRADQDDGRDETLSHFSHVFEPEPARLMVMRARLPEIHAWLAVPGRDPVLIDPTTGSWPEKCRLQTGMDWPGDPPPPYLWAPASRIPARVAYLPHVKAIEYAAAFARAAATGGPLILRP